MQLRFVLPLLIASCSAPIVAPGHEDKIFAGDELDLEAHPFAVRVERRDGNWWRTFCSGALIAEDIVLTAAHCFVGGRHSLVDREVRVVAPGAEEPVRIVIGGVVDSAYTDTTALNCVSSDTAAHDLLLLRVERPYPGDLVGDLADSSPPAMTRAIAIGAGWDGQHGEPTDLRQGSMEIVSHDERGVLEAHRTDNVGGSLCGGDSGGPLVANGAIAGVAAKSDPRHRNSRCGISEAYFADVAIQRQWIDQAMSALSHLDPNPEATHGWLEPSACLDPAQPPELVGLGVERVSRYPSIEPRWTASFLPKGYPSSVIGEGSIGMYLVFEDAAELNLDALVVRFSPFGEGPGERPPAVRIGGIRPQDGAVEFREQVGAYTGRGFGPRRFGVNVESDQPFVLTNAALTLPLQRNQP